MLSRFVVKAFDSFVELLLWVGLIGGTSAGYFLGHSSSYRGQNAFMGAALGFIGTLLIEIFVFGAILTLSQMLKKLEVIERNTRKP